MSDATIDFHTNPRLVPDDVTMRFGTGNDARLVWSTADADNHSLALALGDSNQALHVTDAGAVATDWSVAADTHPALYVHSNTTPATDYLKIGGHDGTNATIDLVGGTTLKIAFDGSAEIDISATALSPASDGGNALGTTSLGWNGLHLNTGTAINWENGDVTLTHAAGKVTWGGDGAVEIDFNNHEMTNVDIDSGAIDGAVIGATSPAAGTFTTIAGTAFSVSAAGLVFINETANADMTIGLTINQGANADDIFAFKSSDVTNVHSSQAESDTFMAMLKVGGGDGGWRVDGFTSAWNGILLQAFVDATDADDTDTTSSTATNEIKVWEDNGSGGAQVVAAGNIFAVRNGNTTRLILKQDGELHIGNTTLALLSDAEEDAMIVRGMQVYSPDGPRDGVVWSEWDDRNPFHNKSELQRVGVLGKSDPKNPDAEPLVIINTFLDVLAGAAWQRFLQQKQLENELASLRTQMLALGAG